MILWVVIEFFGVKIVITDILSIFTDILLIFFFRNSNTNSSTSARAPQSRFFCGKIGDFIDFSSDRFFLCFFFSVPTENRFFDDISNEKKHDFLFLDYNISNIVTL